MAIGRPVDTATINVGQAVRGNHKLYIITTRASVNTLVLRQNGRHFADDSFKCNFLDENEGIPLKISLTFVSKGPIDNIRSLVQIMAWRLPCYRPLSDPVMGSLWTHVCVTRSQWVKPPDHQNSLEPCVLLDVIQADSRLAPSQWETSLQSNAISHWRGAHHMVCCDTIHVSLQSQKATSWSLMAQDLFVARPSATTMAT